LLNYEKLRKRGPLLPLPEDLQAVMLVC